METGLLILHSTFLLSSANWHLILKIIPWNVSHSVDDTGLFSWVLIKWILPYYHYLVPAPVTIKQKRLNRNFRKTYSLYQILNTFIILQKVYFIHVAK